SIEFCEIGVIAEDMANTAGRNAAMTFEPWLHADYDTYIIDASAMSRGVCFPIVKQAYLHANKSSAVHTHLVIAEKEESALNVQSMSSDSPQYMHGFQADMDTDAASDAIKLWLPQLSEKNRESLER